MVLYIYIIPKQPKQSSVGNYCIHSAALPLGYDIGYIQPNVASRRRHSKPMWFRQFPIHSSTSHSGSRCLFFHFPQRDLSSCMAKLGCLTLSSQRRTHLISKVCPWIAKSCHQQTRTFMLRPTKIPIYSYNEENSWSKTNNNLIQKFRWTERANRFIWPIKSSSIYVCDPP